MDINNEREEEYDQKKEESDQEQQEQTLLLVQEQSLRKINENLEEYVDLCSQIKNVKEELKIFTERKGELEVSITNYMKINQVPEFVTDNGKNKIRLYESKTKTPLNKDYLREALSEKIKDIVIQDEIIKLAFDRPSNHSFKVKLYAPSTKKK